jgi:hypothetical protein
MYALADWLLLSVSRFVIGRERPGQVSEVAALIQQTLEQERRQREMLEQQYAQYAQYDDEVGSLLPHCLTLLLIHLLVWPIKSYTVLLTHSTTMTNLLNH